MEIERKFLIKDMPDLSQYKMLRLEQAYMCTDPTIRIRREDDEYYMTYKGKGFMAKEEYNLPLTKESYEHLLPKCDGNIIRKNRYLIPLGPNKEGNELTAELDVFDAPFAPLRFVEVEFPTIEEAESFVKPDWMGEDVTEKREYYNSYMSKQII